MREAPLSQGFCFSRLIFALEFRGAVRWPPSRSSEDSAFQPHQHNAPLARVLQVPDADQSTRPEEYDGINTNVSEFKPLVAVAVPVMTPLMSNVTDATYFVPGLHPAPGPTQERYWVCWFGVVLAGVVTEIGYVVGTQVGCGVASGH